MISTASQMPTTGKKSTHGGAGAKDKQANPVKNGLPGSSQDRRSVLGQNGSPSQAQSSPVVVPVEVDTTTLSPLCCECNIDGGKNCLACDGCDSWIHYKCAKLSGPTVTAIRGNPFVQIRCTTCRRVPRESLPSQTTTPSRVTTSVDNRLAALETEIIKLSQSLTSFIHSAPSQQQQQSTTTLLSQQQQQSTPLSQQQQSTTTTSLPQQQQQHQQQSTTTSLSQQQQQHQQQSTTTPLSQQQQRHQQQSTTTPLSQQQQQHQQQSTTISLSQQQQHQRLRRQQIQQESSVVQISTLPPASNPFQSNISWAEATSRDSTYRGRVVYASNTADDSDTLSNNQQTTASAQPQPAVTVGAAEPSASSILKGVANPVHVPKAVFYVRNLSLDDTEDKIKAHFSAIDITCTHVTLFHRRQDADLGIQNCRIVVHRSDAERVRCPLAWPRDVVVRDWKFKPKSSNPERRSNHHNNRNNNINNNDDNNNSSDIVTSNAADATTPDSDNTDDNDVVPPHSADTATANLPSGSNNSDASQSK